MRGIQAHPRADKYFNKKPMKFVNTTNTYKKRKMKIPQKVQKKLYKMSGTNSAAKIKEKIEKFILYSHQKNRKPIKATFMCINTLSKKRTKSLPLVSVNLPPVQGSYQKNSKSQKIW